MMINPDCDMKMWEVSNTDGCILANADNYYTKAQIDKKLEEINELISNLLSKE